MNDAYLPDHLKNSYEREGYQRVANQYRDRGETVIWGPSGPYILLDNGAKFDVSISFMYPTIINLKH